MDINKHLFIRYTHFDAAYFAVLHEHDDAMYPTVVRCGMWLRTNVLKTYLPLCRTCTVIVDSSPNGIIYEHRHAFGHNRIITTNAYLLGDEQRVKRSAGHISAAKTFRPFAVRHGALALRVWRYIVRNNIRLTEVSDTVCTELDINFNEQLNA